MGQAASRATSLAKKVPGISQTRASAESEWKKSSAAVDINETKMPEMPPDLLKFLKDVGPLKRTVDKERTSPKVYDLLSEERALEDAKQANTRVRRRMPLLSAAGSDEEGSTVMRTTNFSTKDSKKEGFGLDRCQLFRVLSKLNGGSGEDSLEWKSRVKVEFNSLVSKNDGRDEDRLEQDLALFESAVRYMAVPVLMKDTDGDIIGTWSQKVNDYKFLGLKEVPENSAEYVMFKVEEEI